MQRQAGGNLEEGAAPCARMAVPRLETTLGVLGLFYVLVALLLGPGAVQAGLLLAGAVFSGGAVLVWLLRRRRGRIS